MHLRHLGWSLLGLLLGCATTQTPTNAPRAIAATENMRVWFHYDFVDVQTGERVQGSGERPEVLLIGEETSNPFDAALQQVLRDHEPGYRTRVLVPAEVLDAGKPPRAPSAGDKWLTVSIEHVDEPKPPSPRAGIDAFTGEPLTVSTLNDGSQLQEYARGDGRPATKGDIVELYMMIRFADHEVGSPDEPFFVWMDDVDTRSEWLLGAKPGARRKVTYGSMAIYVQVLDVLR